MDGAAAAPSGSALCGPAFLLPSEHLLSPDPVMGTSPEWNETGPVVESLHLEGGQPPLDTCLALLDSPTPVKN